MRNQIILHGTTNQPSLECHEDMCYRSPGQCSYSCGDHMRIWHMTGARNHQFHARKRICYIFVSCKAVCCEMVDEVEVEGSYLSIRAWRKIVRIGSVEPLTIGATLNVRTTKDVRCRTYTPVRDVMDVVNLSWCTGPCSCHIRNHRPL